MYKKNHDGYPCMVAVRIASSSRAMHSWNVFRIGEHNNKCGLKGALRTAPLAMLVPGQL